MPDSKIFCMCLHDHHLQNLKKLNYIPVGLGKNTFSNDWLKDNTGINISYKNSHMVNTLFTIGFGKII